MTLSKRKLNTTRSSFLENNGSLYTRVCQKARFYFIGSIYPNVSHVLGTSLVFYLIGSRVQFMISQTSMSKDKHNTIFTFWLETTFLVLFVVTDLMILSLFPLWKCKSKTEQRLGLATIIDLFIVCSVLLLLFLAEARRCCTNGEEAYSNAIGIDYDFESECTCPEWGVRTYNGIGMIEPFTSLIFLRLFRFHLARVLMRIFSKKKDSIKHDNNFNAEPPNSNQ